MTYEYSLNQLGVTADEFKKVIDKVDIFIARAFLGAAFATDNKELFIAQKIN